MDVEKILLDNGYEGVKYFVNPSYADALIGVSEDNRAVYDYDKMIAWLVKEDGLSEEDAADFISYNTIRAIPYMGEGAPIVVIPICG